jgi:hypothetical protein
MKGLVFIIVIFFIGLANASNINVNISNVSDTDEIEYWALLIAVGVYADNPQQNIPFMLEYVDDLYDLLLESDWWIEGHIKVIKGKNATATNIIDGLKWLDEMEDENDISLVYITTHGGPLPYDRPPFDEDDKHDECLSTYWSFVYPSALIWDDELNFFLSRLESKGVCLIVDSCFAGGFNDPPYKAEMINTIENFGQKKHVSMSRWVDGFMDDVSDHGRVILMACREDEYADMLMFTPRVIDGLKGFADENTDGIVSAEEIFNYTKPRCHGQQPTMYDGHPGELPIITYNPTQDDEWETGQYNNCDSLTKNKNTLPYVENSNVCGYITDQSTNGPIENAYVTLSWRDSTYSDLSGYYRINVAAEKILLNIFADYYFHDQTDWISIGDNVTLWLNFSLIPYPPENSVICGFITDESTGEPIVDARLSLSWRDGEYNYNNHTNSDIYGYYSINAATGDTSIHVRADKYFKKDTDWFNIGDDEIFWLNVSLESFPPENSVVCGYVTDESTGFAIEGAHVALDWIYDNECRYWNHTETDHDGFFNINVASGKIELRLHPQGYLRVEESYYILDEETLWINISLCPLPAENSIICGYILDNETFDPLSGYTLGVRWLDGKGHYKSNHTYTNRYGYFEMNVACGEIYFWINCEGYNPIRTYRKDVYANEISWFNMSLKKDPIRVDIFKPLNAIYIGNHRILPSSIGIIVGSIDIKVYAHDYWYQSVEIFKMEFYVDNVLKATVNSEPYVWNWNDITFGRHAVKIVAYDSIGNSASDEITVRKLF